jgi:hypothetical protein
LLLSVTALSVPPPVFESTTVAPPEISLLLFASFAWTVTVEVEEPFAVTDAGEAEIVVFEADTAPGVSDTDVGTPIAEPAIVPVIDAEPDVVPLVNVAVYVPLLLFVTDPSDPRLVESTTVPPLAVRLLPFTSFAWTVTVEVADPFAETDAGEAEIVEVEADTTPGVNDTEALWPIAEPAIVPLIVADPEVVALVSVAVYVPLPLSVTTPSEPRFVDRATVPPLAVRLLPFASFAWTVTVEVEDPLAVIDAGDAEIVVFEADTAPGVKDTEAGLPIEVPPMVPDTVAEPVVVGLVNVAVYVPLLLFVTDPSDPRLVDRTTVPPLEVKLLPLASFAWTVTVEVEDPVAEIDAGDAEIVVVEAATAPGMSDTDVGLPIAVPPIVPVIEAEPVVVGLVSVAEYVPSLLLLTAPSEPELVDRTTVPPLEVKLLPLASFAWTVTVEVDDPLAVIDAGEAEIAVVEADTTPGVNDTEALWPIAEPAIVPVIEAEPVVVGLVSVAEYVPLLLLVTEPSEPADADRTTAPPLAVRLLPFASFAWTVTVEVEDPFAVIDPGEAAIVVVGADTAPGVNDTDVGTPIAVPAIVPVIAAEPVVVPLVNVAVYVPLLLFVTDPSDPKLVDRTTVPPLEVRLLPFASFAWTMTVEVDDPLAVIDAGEAEIVVVEADTAPGTNDTEALWPIAEPAIVPDTVAEPLVVALVSVAEYVPSLLLVTDPSEPDVVERTTVPPLEVRLLPLASVAWTVTVEVDDPLAVIDAGDAEIVVVEADTAPDVNDTEALWPIAEPPMVPDTVAEPVVVGLVRVAEYVPSLLLVTDPSEPDVVERTTVPPLEVRLLPLASFAWTVTVEADDPFAVIDAGEAEIVVVEADTPPGVNDTDVGLPIAVPPIVPVIEAEPVVVGLVSVAEYVPLALSVTELRLPRVVDRTTVPPLEVKLLPLASFAWTVIVEVDDPFAVIDAGDAEIAVVEADTAPGAKDTEALWPIAELAIVPDTVADPVAVPLVNVAV